MLALLLLLVVSAAEAWPQPSTAARNQDLDYVANQLPKLHANFYFQLDPATYQQAVADLRTNLPSMTNEDFYVALASLVAMAGDAHTFIGLTGSTASQMIGFHQFPLTLRWLDDGVYVTAAAAPY